MFTLLAIFVALFLVSITWPLLKKVDPALSDRIYEWREEHRRMPGKKKAWRLFVHKTSPYINPSIVSKVDRLLRLAGRPGKVRAVDLIIRQLLIGVGVALLSTQVPTEKGAVFLMAIILAIKPITSLDKRKKARQLEASEAIRFLKRRFVMLLKMGVPLTDALREIADLAPGEFGITMRTHLDQLGGGRSLREVMQDLRYEFEVRELDEFCVAIEMSDQKSSQILVDLIARQVRDEIARQDEFITNKVENTRPKLLSLVLLSSLWSLGLFIFFGYYGFTDKFKGGGGFLFW